MALLAAHVTTPALARKLKRSESRVRRGEMR
jgi:hypothetical protein